MNSNLAAHSGVLPCGPATLDSWLGETPRYVDLMADGTPFIALRICLSQPPELFDLIGAFAAIGHQFDQYIRDEHPNLEGTTHLFVKEIRRGSIELDLIPHIPALIATMDAVLIVDNFVTRYRTLLNAFIGGTPPPAIGKSDTKNFLDTVRLVAKDPRGSASISSAVYRENGPEKHVEIHFTSQQAAEARQVLERQIIENEAPVFEEFKDVLMVFWQSNRKMPKTGKPTGEKAIIEAVSKKPLAIKYESDLARERIKYEATEDPKNIFKKGFYVDGFVERFNGKPVALRIAAVKDVIDLPDDEAD
jgi:hypothetical protein